MGTCINSIKMVISKKPIYLFAQILLISINVASTLIPIDIVNMIVQMYQDGNTIKDMAIGILVRFSILLVLFIAKSFINIWITNMSVDIQAKTSIMFYDKLAYIDYSAHESPDFLDDFTRSLDRGVNNIYIITGYVFTLISILFQSLGIFTKIAGLNWPVVAVVIVITIFYFLIYLRIGYLNKLREDESRPYKRRAWYNFRLISLKYSMEDMKTTALDQLIIDKEIQSQDELIAIANKYLKRNAILGFISDILLAFLYPIMILMIVFYTVDISSHLPEFASLTIAASIMSGIIKQAASTVGLIEENVPDTKVSFTALKMKGKIEGIIKKDIPSSFERLDIKHVNFSYIGSDKLQLNDINFHIKEGEKVAIIGGNGAGKTTLVKLLLRLYDPNSGVIEINGQDYTDTTPDAIRKMVGTVFQNANTYAISIAENVLLRKPKTKADYELIDKALKFSDLYDYVYSLDDNINTQISREFVHTGAVLSGGQTQKLAIARGYAQQSDLFILDEPSSALDPLAEARMYNNMMELGKEKTLVFISHRLTSTINADRIYLFEKGRIVESGTHDELMAKDGLYKKMFISQSYKYLGDSNE